MSEQPQTIFVTKSVLADGKIEKILAFKIPTTEDWMGWSGRWRGIRIDHYYVFMDEAAAVKEAGKRIAYQIESNEARNKTLATLKVHLEDLTEEASQAAE